MRTISESVYELLMAQGLRAMTAATVEAHGIDAWERANAAHPAIGPHTGGGKRDQSGMRVKGTLAETSAEFTGGRQTQGGRNHSAKARIYLAYVSNMPTRQGRSRARLSLVRT